MLIGVKFGYQQDSGAFGALALPIDESAIVNSRQEMFAHIEAFVNHKIEQMFLPMLGDLLVSSVREFTTTFTPIEQMKTALLTGAVEEDAERHMIAFLHEVQTGLPAAIKTYKAEYPRYLLPADTQTYANGKTLLSEAEETVMLRFLPQGTQLTYATGPIGEYFRNFMKRCYERAQTLLNLSKRFDGKSYEAFSIEQLSRMARVINGEVEGFKIEVIDESEYYTVKLHNRTLSLYQRDEPIYIAYEDLEELTLTSPYGGTDTKKVIKLTNMGQTAMVAKAGRTSPDESAVDRADYSPRTQVTTPSTHEYSKADVGKEITFEKMDPPEARSLDEIELRVGDLYPLSVADKFDGKFIREGYHLSEVDTQKVSVTPGSSMHLFNITALKRGTTFFKIIAINPAGRTPLIVDVNIT